MRTVLNTRQTIGWRAAEPLPVSATETVNATDQTHHIALTWTITSGVPNKSGGLLSGLLGTGPSRK